MPNFQNVETQTIPPPRSTYGGNVLQWVIYDSYAADFEQSEKDKEKEKDKKSSVAGGGGGGATNKKDSDKSKKGEKTIANEELNKAYLQAWQILERMINQNIYDEIAQGESNPFIYFKLQF